jgi:NTE family protein
MVVSSDLPSTREREVGLALSGGGYRAALFHLGAIVRINQMGKLRTIDRISSVSGGSLAAGLLAMAWPELTFDAGGRATNLRSEFVAPLLRATRLWIDIPIVALGMAPGIQPSAVLAHTWDVAFFRGRTLQDLPTDADGPRFVFNATELGSGTLWRMARPYMVSHRIGQIREPQLRLAEAVAASAAFPPIMSPLTVPFDPRDLQYVPGADLHPQYAALGQVVLSDGGVYDNLGVQSLGDDRDLLISDAGGNLRVDTKSAKWQLWTLQAKRVFDIAVSQERAQRRDNLIPDADSDRPPGRRRVSYWRTLSDPGQYTRVTTPFDVAPGWPVYLAGRSTRLWPFPRLDRQRLVNWVNRPEFDGGSTPWRMMESCQTTRVRVRSNAATRPSCGSAPSAWWPRRLPSRVNATEP